MQTQRVRLEEEFHKARDAWESEHQLDEVVDEMMWQRSFHSGQEFL